MKIYIDGSGWNGRVSKYCILPEGCKEEVRSFEIEKTNNQMEYQALLTALSGFAEPDDEIITDSQLIVGQVTKGWKCNVSHLREMRDYCLKIMKNKKVKITWVPRNENLAGKVLEKLKEK